VNGRLKTNQNRLKSPLTGDYSINVEKIIYESSV